MHIANRVAHVKHGYSNPREDPLHTSVEMLVGNLK
jgi:hypothetical protein